MHKTYKRPWSKHQNCLAVDSELNKEAKSSKSNDRSDDTTIPGIGARPLSQSRSSLLFVVVSTLILLLSVYETRARDSGLIQNEIVTITDTWDFDGTISIGGPIEQGLFPLSQLNIEGGQVTSQSGIVGNFFGEVSSATISGETGSWSTGILEVGSDSYGQLFVREGGTLNSTNARVGDRRPLFGSAHGGGLVSIEADSTWNNSSTIRMGNQNPSLLSVDGTVNTMNAILGEAGQFNAGVADIRGDGSMNITEQLTLGLNSQGQLNLTGGAMAVGRIVMGQEMFGSGRIYLAGREGNRSVLQTSQIEKGRGSASLRFGGGILQASRDEEDFLSDFSDGDVMFENGNTILFEGQIVDTGGAFIDTNGYDIGIATSIGGSSFLTKKGEGTLILSGDNTYSDGTLVSTGTLQIGAGGNRGSVEGSIENNSILTFNHSSDHTHGGAISGTGTLLKEGEGKLTLTGNNTFSGGTIVSNGALQIGDGEFGNLRGNIENNSTLIFNRITTFDDVISGSGDLIKEGSQTLRLTNNNTYTGTTTINEGTLRFEAGLPSAGAEIRVTGTGRLSISGTVSRNLRNNATVFSQGDDPTTLSGEVSGNGRFTGNIVRPGNFIFAGITRPGDGPGRIEVDGDLRFAPEHTLDVEIGGTAPGTEHDQIAVRKPPFTSGGTFTLGGTAIIRLTNGFIPEKDDEFAILTADSFSGNFSDIDLSGAELPAELSWDTSNFSTTGIIRVVGQTFSRWADEFGVAPDAEDDPLGDGFPLLMKYALGLDPTVRASVEDMPSLTIAEENGNEFLTLIVNRSAVRDDVSIIGEVSEDLIEWTAAGVDLIEETPGKLVFRDSTHITRGTQRFMRIKFAPTP